VFVLKLIRNTYCFGDKRGTGRDGTGRGTCITLFVLSVGEAAGGITGEWLFGKDWKGNSRKYILVIFLEFVSTEE
jgi:hypothetical protein